MTQTPTPTFDLTLFPTIFHYAGVHKAASWADLVEAFGTHLRTEDKTSTPGFGPYGLHDRVCDRPKHPKAPHRCDVCVDALSLAVFDVDFFAAGLLAAAPVVGTAGGDAGNDDFSAITAASTAAAFPCVTQRS